MGLYRGIRLGSKGSRVLGVVCRGAVVELYIWFFLLMIRRPPRATQSRSSAASDVYKRQRWHRSWSADSAQASHRAVANDLAALVDALIRLAEWTGERSW